jgi:hypothetical protein
MKLLYQIAVSLIWAAGLLCIFTLATLLMQRPEILSSAMFAPILVLGLLTGSSVTIFSFWAGAQPGHLFRALNVFLSSLLSFLVLQDYYLNPGADLAKSSKFIMVAVVIMVLNLSYGPKLKEMYRRDGRTDYFKRYFDR